MILKLKIILRKVKEKRYEKEFKILAGLVVPRNKSITKPHTIK